MSEHTCQVPDCDRPRDSRGYCAAHHKRLLRHGDPQAWKPLKVMPTADERGDVVARILKRSVLLDNGCIEWRGSGLPTGYGTIRWHGRTTVVHRAMWTALVGNIPDDADWTLDHLCSNRACVNVGHLEVVLRGENSRRGGGLLIAQRTNRRRFAEMTHCKNGHEWAPENIGGEQGDRWCRQCKRESWAKHSAKVNEKRRADRAAQKGS